jgi:hypothetical protein
MKPGSQPIETTACPLARSCVAPVPGGETLGSGPDARRRGGRGFSSAYEEILFKAPCSPRDLSP